MAEFTSVPPSSLSFPRNEGEILEFWENPEHFTKSAFFESLDRNKELPLYSFYDGPPFASGNPHHGHILAGTIKDVVTRYAHQTGHNVPRRFGWDCHGVPVENEINKMHNISRREDVLGRSDRGVKWYNDECRKIVMRCVDRWQSTTRRLGRWIDFESDYKTMDVEFMESVWSVFRRLYDLNLVYRGERVMPVSTSLGTPVSKHETGPETYQDTSDLSVFVTFNVVGDSGEELVAWTTTPWTLVSNIGLCVNANMTYIKLKVKKTGRVLVLAKDQAGQLFPEADYDVVGSEFPGSQLKGTRYHAMFPLFDSPEYFQVVCDDYVTAGSGSGIVHLAPGFGEDDHRVCMLNGLIKEGSGLPCPVDDEGHFTNELLFVNPSHELASKLVGKHVKTKEEGNANSLIVANLKQEGKLLKSGSIVHKVPFCSRSKTPLIFKAVKSWFIRVDTGEIDVPGCAEKRSLRDVMVENNQDVRWVPDFVGKGRFHEWLKQARDWNVSRNRFWGTPIPIWESEDGTERVCVGSLQELADLSGNPQVLTDIHREFVDQIEFRLRPDGPLLRRVPELFDCWFESGSMPYATSKYKFDPKDFAKPPPSTYPADFIAEGLDQTRGWFYTLMVLSTALFKVPPFKNVIVNGLVLAEDGKKMSKSLKNYPPPEDVMERHGADALRLYLINSPVVKAEPLRFSEEGVSGVVRDVFLPWLNALRFFLQNVKRSLDTSAPWDTGLAKQRAESSSNTMDMWILAEMRDLVVCFRREMDAYRLYNVLPRLLLFIDSLTNWYVRLNRNRLKGGSRAAAAATGEEDEEEAGTTAGEGGDADTLCALSTLFEVLLQLSRLMAPVAPFFAEYAYQQLVPKHSPRREAESVHFLPIPERVELSHADEALLRKFRALQTAVQLGRNARQSVKTKTPVVDLVLVADSELLRSDLREMEPYLKLELNALKVTVPEDPGVWGQVQLVFNEATLGKKYKKDRTRVIAAVKALPDVNALLLQLESLQEVEVVPGLPTLANGDVSVSRLFAPVGQRKEDFGVESNRELMVAANLASNSEVEALSLCREFKSQVQKLRKKLGLDPEDAVQVYCQIRGPAAKQAEDVLQRSELSPVFGSKAKYAVRVGSSDKVAFQPDHEWDICLCRPVVQVLNPDLPDSILQLLSGVGSLRLKQSGDVFKCSVDGQRFALQRGVDYKV